MLPALTGAAMLHTSSEKYAGMLRQCMSLFASTSPSYLIMASLDLCCKYISEQIRADISTNLEYINCFREAFADRLSFAEGDPFHITIKAGESGLSGADLAEKLRRNGAECEYADTSLVILLMSPMNTAPDYVKLGGVLERALADTRAAEPSGGGVVLPLPERAMSIRDAAFAPSVEIPVEEAEGRICASVKVPCPPAVPIAASGEVISRECIELFRRYGIPAVLVVDERKLP
jgi:arginine/lysine/ornithine decarboxylase